MVRPPGIEFAGGLYHITSRGNVRQHIYFDNRDRTTFQELIDKTRTQFDWYIHAYCLMSNLYHLLIAIRVTVYLSTVHWDTHFCCRTPGILTTGYLRSIRLLDQTCSESVCPCECAHPAIESRSAQGHLMFPGRAGNL